MECRDEYERYENRVVPRDIVFTAESLAIQAIIDHMCEDKPPETSPEPA